MYKFENLGYSEDPEYIETTTEKFGYNKHDKNNWWASVEINGKWKVFEGFRTAREAKAKAIEEYEKTRQNDEGF